MEAKQKLDKALQDFSKASKSYIKSKEHQRMIRAFDKLGAFKTRKVIG